VLVEATVRKGVVRKEVLTERMARKSYIHAVIWNDNE
jgi:hypothetical protein